MTPRFLVLGVVGRSVRVKCGLLTVDVRVETVGVGKYRVVKPDDVHVHSTEFPAFVEACIRAYKTSLENGGAGAHDPE